MNNFSDVINDSIMNGLVNFIQVQILFIVLYFLYKALCSRDFRKPKIEKKTYVKPISNVKKKENSITLKK